MKKIISLLSIIVVIVVLFAIYRASTLYVDQQFHPSSKPERVVLDQEQVLANFSKAIQIATISQDYPAPVIPEPFLAFHQHLQLSFPKIHQVAQRTLINKYSLIYKFQGSDTSLKPVLLMGHIDVVPVEEETKDKWTHDAFAGVISEGKVWGRGALDDKATVMALMEAMELSLKQGKRPQRTLYFAFGHDEEVGGSQGAKYVADYFIQQGVKFEFVLDEGGAILKGYFDNVPQSVGIIGIAEKGFVNIRLIAQRPGGHSSTPPNNTGPGILAAAIVKLEQNKFPASLRYTNLTFDAIGSYADFTSRFAMANQWLTAPLITKALLADQSKAAGLRTTTAVTMMQGSSKSNILPTSSSVVVNFRILPGETWETVLAEVKNIVNDERLEFEVFMNNNPSKVSGTDSQGYKWISQTIREFEPDTLVAPYLVMGGTDSKYFYPLSDSVYRFLMIKLTPDKQKTIHGINEHIDVVDYIEGIQFFHELIRKVTFDNEAPQ